MEENGKLKSHLVFGLGTVAWAIVTWYLIKLADINFAAHDTFHKGVVTIWLIVFVLIAYYAVFLKDFIRSFQKKG